MDGASQLERFVDSIVQEGEFQDTGAFTLHWASAIEKTAVAAQSEPNQWLLFMIQAGVAASAGQIRVQCNGNLVTVDWELDRLPSELESPARLLGGSQSPLQRFLSSAVLWGQALKPEAMELLCQAPGRTGYLIRIQGEREKISEIKADTTPIARVSLLFRPAGSSGWLARLRSRGSAENLAELATYLQPRLRYSPIPVLAGQKLLNRGEALLEEEDGSPPSLLYRRLYLTPPTSAGCLAAAPCYRWPAARVTCRDNDFNYPTSASVAPYLGLLELAGQVTSKPFQVGTQGPGPTHLIAARWTNPKPHCACLHLGYSPYLQPEHEELRCRALAYRLGKSLGFLRVVHYGVALNSIRLPELAPEGWGWVVASHSLPTDVSGQEVVHGPELKRVLDWLYREVRLIYERRRT